MSDNGKRYEWRVRWRPGLPSDAPKWMKPKKIQTATFQTKEAALRQAIKLGPEPWRAWGYGPEDEFHVDGCEGREGGDCSWEGCPGTWREAFKTRPPTVFLEIVRREVGPWKPYLSGGEA